jgi:hypothetical protein
LCRFTIYFSCILILCSGGFCNDKHIVITTHITPNIFQLNSTSANHHNRKHKIDVGSIDISEFRNIADAPAKNATSCEDVVTLT